MRYPTLSAPPILYGAYALAGLSLIWSGYAITDLIHSGVFGLSVALAGDIGWITVMWAEHRRIGGWYATAAGWAIALMVGALLVLHGILAHNLGQAIAGPFVVLVGKTVATFALLAMRDPAALTDEQEAEINDVIRSSEHQARMHAAQLNQFAREADARIARIHAEARVTLARDDADFEIGLARLEKRAAIERNSPITGTPERQLFVVDRKTGQRTPIAEQREQRTYEFDHRHQRWIASNPEQPPATSPNTDREQKSIADLARDHVVIHPTNPAATDAICSLRPEADRDSVAAAVRRARQKLDGGLYR